MQIRQQFLKPGWYGTPSTGMRELTADDLRRYHQDTNAALSAGLPIPILDDHCNPDALDGPEAESIRTRGWLKKLHVNKDGSLSHESDIPDTDVAAKIKAGTIKFVSPQLNPEFEKNGEQLGSIVRHLALTPKPVNSDQGAMEVLALSEDDKSKPFAVSLSNYAGAKMPKAKKKPDTAQLAEDFKKKKPDEEEEVAADVTEEAAPETPPADEQETAEVVTNDTGVDDGALLNQVIAKMGLVLPEGMSLDSPEAIRLVLVAVLNAAANEAETEELPMETIEEEQPEMAQFTETESALMARLQALEARETARVTQQRRSNLNIQLATAGLPPALTKRLKSLTSAVQFSEAGAEQPAFTVSQVVALVKDTFPPSVLQLAEGGAATEEAIEEATEEEDHPDGKFFDDADGRPNFSQQEAAIEAKRSEPRKFGHSPAGETQEVIHKTDQSTAPTARKRGPGRPKGSKTKTK